MTNQIVEKTCSRCKESKPLSNFYVDDNASGGYRAQCKKCKAQVAQNHRAKFWTPAYRRKLTLWRLYGLTPEDYEGLLQKQDYKCAICGQQHDTRPRKGLRVDHDHETGVVRGLLCDPCNSALGRLGDSISGVERALQYLYQASTYEPRQKKDLRHARRGQSPNPEYIRRGEKASNAKLTDAEVTQIRQDYANGISQTKIAKTLHLSQSLISGIVLGKSWRHLLNEKEKEQLDRARNAYRYISQDASLRRHRDMGTGRFQRTPVDYQENPCFSETIG